MKSFRLLLGTFLFLIFSSTTFAQITFSSTDAQGVFALGKYWVGTRLDTANTTMDLKSPSTNTSQAWTLPTVVYTDSSRQDNMNPSSTPYASSFPGSTVAQRERSLLTGRTNIFFNFLRITTDSLIDKGEVDSSQTVQIRRRNDVFGLFPFMIGQTLSAARDSQSTGTNSWQIQTTTATFDAYGTITSSAGTFNTLRRKETRIQDNYINNAFSFRDTSVQFLWLTKDNVFFSVNTKYAYQTAGVAPISKVEFQRVAGTTAVADFSPILPSQFELLNNYPNPFNPSTNIEFRVDQRNFVTLQVFDNLGREIATLVKQELPSGKYRRTFDATNLPSGVYYYRLSVGGQIKTGEMTLLK